MLNPEQLVFAAILTCIGGGLLTLLTSRNKVLSGMLALAVTAASAVMIFLSVFHVLRWGPDISKPFPLIPNVGFILRFHVDGLSAVFLSLAALLALPAALYSINYMRHYADYTVTRYYPNFLLFLAAMYGLLSTTDMMWFFFVFWQMMTLTGYGLIRFEYRKPQNIRAANKYLIMMQIACAATMVGAEMLAYNGGTSNNTSNYDFATVSGNMHVLLSTKAAATAVAFALFLVGFGIKMGMWPFGQIWLPDAHPAAPSPVSAMLSGVMIKTGVYGLMRYFLWLVPHDGWAFYPLANWGLLIAVLGTITLFTGTMQALKQEQTKRLLAFHSIGQVGYIILGTGACMALIQTQPLLAALALFGALFHVLNHGVFKGLLFLNAGSMLDATGTQDMNKLGGLIKYMPITAITTLVACFSISGVPMFNGFASKWAIYAATIHGGSGARYLPVFAVIAILTSTLTLASFIKFFGAGFLSRSSDLVKQRAAERQSLEVGFTMQLPQLVLAGICVLLGVFPVIAIRFLQAALLNSPDGCGDVLANNTHALEGNAWHGMWVFQDPITSGKFVPLALLVVIGGMLLLVRRLARLGDAKHRAAEPWLCGYVREADCHRYVAHNFYGEIKRYFGWLGGKPHKPAEIIPAIKETT